MSFTTGSGLERAVNCRASAALPRIWSESTSAASLGTAIHAYLEALANGATPEDAEMAVAEEHRAECAELDVASLSRDLKLSAEVTLVYRPSTDTARVLGQSLARDYSTVEADEIPMTLDLVGVDLANHRGAVKDYKSGRGHVAPARHNWQTLGGALALSRVYDLDEVDAEILFTRPGEPIRRSRHMHGTADLLAAARHLRIVGERADADRATHAAGGHVEPTEGPWCRYCPSWSSCPAKAALVRWALTGEADQRPIAVGDLVEALTRVREGKKALEQVEKAILATISEPMLVEVADDGTETWLGPHQKPGNEKLDAAIAVDVAMDVLSIPAEQRPAFTAEVTTITKSAIEKAVKDRVARGAGARTMETILGAVRAKGGATRPTSESVGIYTTRPKALGAGGR